MHLMCRALLPAKLDSDETKSNAPTPAKVKKRKGGNSSNNK